MDMLNIKEKCGQMLFPKPGFNIIKYVNMVRT